MPLFYKGSNKTLNIHLTNEVSHEYASHYKGRHISGLGCVIKDYNCEVYQYIYIYYNKKRIRSSFSLST